MRLIAAAALLAIVMAVHAAETPAGAAAQHESIAVPTTEQPQAVPSPAVQPLARPAPTGLAAARDAYAAIVAAGGWPQLSTTEKLELGSQAPEVLTLRTRLQLSGDLAMEVPASDVFDAVLDEAVRRFQRRHGLEVDGIVGPRTRAALNVSAAERLATIKLNLRRIEALPLVAGTQLVLNIAGAELTVLEDGKPVATHRAIVGRSDWQTPLLTSAITRLDLNPVWTVPPRIVREELLPSIRKNPGYLEREGIRASRDPQTGQVTYRQPAGPDNPLGVVRFFFPNPHAVFLHDTPGKALFERAQRNFSHGCVRVERALELALYLLRNETAWPVDRITAVLDSGVTEEAMLTRPVPITLTYLTAWVDTAGVLQFRNDVYRRDAAEVLGALESEALCGS